MCYTTVKREIKVADNYGKCAHLIPLCYAMLGYALQGAVLELSFFTKPHQPNGDDDQMVPVDPL